MEINDVSLIQPRRAREVRCVCPGATAAFVGFWGLDDADRIAAFVLDFELLDMQVFDEFRVPKPTKYGKIVHLELNKRGIELSRPWWQIHQLELRTKDLGGELAARWFSAGTANYLAICKIRPNIFHLDLRGIPSDSEIAIRIIKGTAPMPRVDLP